MDLRGHIRDQMIKLLQWLPPFRGKLAIGRLIGILLTSKNNAVTFAQLPNGLEIKVSLMSKDHDPLYYFQSYESEIIEVLRRYLLCELCVFIDIGASIGIYSLCLADTVRNYGGKIYAFEPIPSNLAYFRDSVYRNQLDGTIHIVPLAVGAKKGIMEMRLAAGAKVEVGNAVVKAVDSDEEKSEKSYPFRVEMVTLDDCLLDRGVERIDVVKMDIEGYEYFALLGFSKFIAKCRPVIFAEFNQCCMKNVGIAEVDIKNLMKEWDYVEFVLVNGKLERICKYPEKRQWDLFLIPSEKVPTLFL